MYKLKINVVLENSATDTEASFKKSISGNANNISSELIKIYASDLPITQERKKWTTLLRYIENAMTDDE